MLKIDVDQATRTVLLEPEGHLAKQDFQSLAQQVDPLINESGDLNGVLVHASKFPGWDSFASFVAHIQFVNGHHKHVKKWPYVQTLHLALWLKSWGHILYPLRIRFFHIMN